MWKKEKRIIKRKLMYYVKNENVPKNVMHLHHIVPIHLFLYSSTRFYSRVKQIWQ